MVKQHCALFYNFFLYWMVYFFVKKQIIPLSYSHHLLIHSQSLLKYDFKIEQDLI
jgi:hypothetical protein